MVFGDIFSLKVHCSLVGAPSKQPEHAALQQPRRLKDLSLLRVGRSLRQGWRSWRRALLSVAGTGRGGPAARDAAAPGVKPYKVN